MPTPEPAFFRFFFLSYSGTAILLTAIISGFIMGFSPARMLRVYIETFRVTNIPSSPFRRWWRSPR
jgi:lactate permease